MASCLALVPSRALLGASTDRHQPGRLRLRVTLPLGCALILLFAATEGLWGQDVDLTAPVLPNGKITVTFRVTVDNALSAGVSEVCNQGTVNSSEIAPVVTDDPDDATSSSDPTCTQVEAEPDMELVQKTADSLSAAPGDTINYSLVFRNAGDQDATGVVLSETVPTHTTSGTNVGWERTAAGSGLSCDSQPAGTQCFFSIGSVAGQGGNMSVGFQVVVDSLVIGGATQIDNTGSVTDDGSNGADPTLNNSQTSQIPLVAAPDLEMVSKVADVMTAMPGTTINYTLTYANSGDQDATGVVVAETVPASTVSGSNPGWERNVSGSGLNCDSQPAGTVCFFSVGAVTVASGNQVISFQLVVDDPIAAGASQVSNTVSVMDDGTNGADPTANNSQTEVTPVEASPDLVMISKVAGVPTVMPGGTVSYVLTYANSGDQDATGIVLTETVPASTTSGSNPGWERNAAGSGLDCDAEPAGTACFLSIGALPAASGNQVAAFTVNVESLVAAGVATISNTASVADDGTNGADPTANNSQGVMTTLNAEPVFTLTKDYSGPTPFPGDTIPFELTYANTGNQGATGVTIGETVPADSQFNALVSDAGWNCAAVTPGSACTFDVPGEVDGGGGGATVVFAVDLDDPLAVGVAEIDNCADITDDDANGGNPFAQGCTTVNLDTVLPEVTSISSIPSTSDGILEECEVAQVAVRNLAVVFSEAMQNPAGDGGSNDVTNPANYRLFHAAGPNLDIATLSCDLIDPADEEILLAAASYDLGSSTVTLEPALGPGSTLANGQYRFLTCSGASDPGIADGLRDLAGNALDGTGDSNPDDFLREFRVDAGNLFANGSFDCTLADWTATAPAAHHATDADNSPLSGSVRVADVGSAGSGTVSQCVDLRAGDQMLFTSVRLDALPGDFATFMVDCTFFSLSECNVSSQGTAISRSYLLQDTGGEFLPLETDFTAPPGTRSARCSLGFNSVASAVDAFVDSLELFGMSEIFSDGFETGDISAWSGSTP